VKVEPTARVEGKPIGELELQVIPEQSQPSKMATVFIVKTSWSSFLRMTQSPRALQMTSCPAAAEPPVHSVKVPGSINSVVLTKAFQLID